MRIKLDENLPLRLVPILRAQGHETDTVADEGLRGTEDEELWPEVQREGAFFMTKDLHFSDERRYPPGAHHGVLVVRLSDDRSQTVAERLHLLCSTEVFATWHSCLVIVTDHKVRVRRPQPSSAARESERRSSGE